VLRLLSILTVAASAAATPMTLGVRPGPTENFTAILTGEVPGAAAGSVSVSIRLNGAPTVLTVSHPKSERVGGRLRVFLTMDYAMVPADWVDHLRLGSIEYDVHGQLAEKKLVPWHWSGSMPWSAVSVEGREETASAFIRLSSLEMTSFSLFESEARAVVTVRNPFSFPLKIAGATYRLFANGREVGSGQTQGLLLHPKQDNALDFPIGVEHGPMLAAAGGALAAGGEIDGRLQGELSVRLPGGDIAIPLDLSGKVSLSQ
jgi:LEA14-like dessication related protein